MSEKIKTILDNAKKDVSGKWMDVGDVHILLENMAKECATAVKNTGKQCAYTTHDIGIVECTINKCVQSVENLFK